MDVNSNISNDITKLVDAYITCEKLDYENTKLLFEIEFLSDTDKLLEIINSASLSTLESVKTLFIAVCIKLSDDAWGILEVSIITNLNNELSKILKKSNIIDIRENTIERYTYITEIYAEIEKIRNVVSSI